MRGCLLAPLFFLPAWRRPQAPNSWLPGSRVLTLGLRNSDMGPQIYTQGDTPGNGQRWGLLPNSPVTFQGPPKSKDRQSTGERNPGIQRRESPKLRTSTPAPSLSPGWGWEWEAEPSLNRGIFSFRKRKDESHWILSPTGCQSLPSGINTEDSSLLPQDAQPEKEMAHSLVSS